MTLDEARDDTEQRDAPRVEVRSEPRVYGPGSQYSYWQDLALSVLGPARASEAKERLARYQVELIEQAVRGTDEGRRALEVAGEIERSEPRETRAATSSTISSFTTPAYLTGQWAAYRAAPPSFKNQTTTLPLPPYGLQVNVPSFTSATPATQQSSENSGTADASPSGAVISAPLATISAQVPIAQQLFDRGGMSGLSFDKIITDQVMQQLEAQIDAYILSQALANAGTVTDSSAFSIANFYQDIAKAREILTDTAGVRLAPTHVFSTSDLFSFITRQLDSSNRPIVTPDSSALVESDDDPRWLGWKGVHLPGALEWFADDNIPASGSNTQIIVANPSEVFTFDGQHSSFAYPESEASTLTVLVGVRAYVGVIIRFPKAIAAISGSAYPLTAV